MRRACLVLIGLVVGCAFRGNAENAPAEPPELEAVPTFECCSYYLKHDNAKAACKVQYRESGAEKWQTTYQPIYDGEQKQFRGSIVSLKENTAYDLRCEITVDGEGRREISAKCKTWSSHPPVAETINIADVYKTGALTLERKGKADGWIRIIGDGKTIVDGGQNAPNALTLKECSHLILENLVVRGGAINAIELDNCREVFILNCDIAGYGRAGTQKEDGFFYTEAGGRINLDSGIRISKSSNFLIERCYIHDPRGRTNTWGGPTWKSSHPNGPNALYVDGRGGGVVRYNDFIGSDNHRWNDGIEGKNNKGPVGSFYKDSDIYGNFIAFGNDDGTELDGAQMNVRYFQNKIEGFLCGISTAPNRAGPSYIFRNLIVNLGDERSKGGSAIKNGGGKTFSQGRSIFLHNTFVVNGHGIKGVGYGDDGIPERARFIATSRNNILVCRSGCVDDQNKDERCDFDFDLMGNPKHPESVGEFTAKDGAEKNAVFGLPKFVDQAHADFGLHETSRGIDKGTPLDNFSEGFAGAAPDMGALECGSGGMLPARPIALRADKYQLDFAAGESMEVTLYPGTVKTAETFEIRKNAAFDWLSVAPASGVLGGKTKLTVTADATKLKRALEKGAFIVKLGNGYSLPVSVYVTKP
jgi:hypothetical protein